MAFGMRDVRAFAREWLGVPLPADFRIKADHPTMRKVVGRGRRALKVALGEDGWKEQGQRMKTEVERKRLKSEIQRQAELEAEALSVPYEEVLRRLEEGSRQSSQEGKHRIRVGVDVLGRPRNLSPTQLSVTAPLSSPFGGCTSYYEKSKLCP